MFKTWRMENTVSKVKKILLRKTNSMPDNLAVPFAGARAIFECQNKELGNALVSRAKKEAKTASGEYRSASPAVIVPIIIFHSALSLKSPSRLPPWKTLLQLSTLSLIHHYFSQPPTPH
jgi:hypothetical protein